MKGEMIYFGQLDCIWPLDNPDNCLTVYTAADETDDRMLHEWHLSYEPCALAQDLG